MPDIQTEFTAGRNQPPDRSGWVNSVTIVLGAVIVLIALAFAYDLEILRTLEIPKEQALPIVLGSAFAIIFLCTPASRRGPRTNPPWYDIALAAAGLGICVYFAYTYNDLIEDFYFNRHKAFLIGIVIIPLIIEGLRRTAGWILVAVVCLFFVYAFLGHLAYCAMYNLTQGRYVAPFVILTLQGLTLELKEGNNGRVHHGTTIQAGVFTIHL